MQTNHGIALSADGKTLFTSNLASVTAYPYDAAAGTVGTGRVIVTGMSNTGTHPTRAIAVSKVNPDIIMVARGSNGNIDTATTEQSSGRSMIKTFSISGSNQQYTTGGEVLGWGLRNIVGLTEDPFGGVVSFSLPLSYSSPPLTLRSSGQLRTQWTTSVSTDATCTTRTRPRSSTTMAT